MSALILFGCYIFSLGILWITRRWSTRLNTVMDGLYISLLMTGHAAVIVARGIEGHRFPVTDMYETLIVFAWLAAVVGTGLYLKYRIFSIRVISLVAATCILFFSTFIVSEVQPLMPSLRSAWLYFHVGAYFIAYATFAIGFGLSAVFVGVFLREKWGGRHYQGLKDTLEGLIFRILDIGFPFLTMGIVCGAMWASISWGRFWNWDPKEVWAFVTWLVYAGSLHLRHARNLQGIYAALMVAAGFIAILFTYVGVNMFFATMHNYA